MEPHDLHDAELRDRAVRAALGQAPFDVLITGGQLVDLITGCIRPADVGLVGPMIASVHPPARGRMRTKLLMLQVASCRRG